MTLKEIFNSYLIPYIQINKSRVNITANITAETTKLEKNTEGKSVSDIMPKNMVHRRKKNE